MSETIKFAVVIVVVDVVLIVVAAGVVDIVDNVGVRDLT